MSQPKYGLRGKNIKQVAAKFAADEKAREEQKNKEKREAAEQRVNALRNVIEDLVAGANRKELLESDMPYITAADALDICNDLSAKFPSDSGLRHLKASVYVDYIKDDMKTYTVNEMTRMRNELMNANPSSRVASVIQNNFATASIFQEDFRKYAHLASQINSQEDFERVLTENGIVGDDMKTFRAQCMIAKLAQLTNEDGAEMPEEQSDEGEPTDANEWEMGTHNEVETYVPSPNTGEQLKVTVESEGGEKEGAEGPEPDEDGIVDEDPVELLGQLGEVNEVSTELAGPMDMMPVPQNAEDLPELPAPEDLVDGEEEGTAVTLEDPSSEDGAMLEIVLDVADQGEEPGEIHDEPDEDDFDTEDDDAVSDEFEDDDEKQAFEDPNHTLRRKLRKLLRRSLGKGKKRASLNDARHPCVMYYNANGQRSELDRFRAYNMVDALSKITKYALDSGLEGTVYANSKEAAIELDSGNLVTIYLGETDYSKKIANLKYEDAYRYVRTAGVNLGDAENKVLDGKPLSAYGYKLAFTDEGEYEFSYKGSKIRTADLMNFRPLLKDFVMQAAVEHLKHAQDEDLMNEIDREVDLFTDEGGDAGLDMVELDSGLVAEVEKSGPEVRVLSVRDASGNEVDVTPEIEEEAISKYQVESDSIEEKIAKFGGVDAFTFKCASCHEYSTVPMPEEACNLDCAVCGTENTRGQIIASLSEVEQVDFNYLFSTKHAQRIASNLEDRGLYTDVVNGMLHIAEGSLSEEDVLKMVEEEMGEIENEKEGDMDKDAIAPALAAGGKALLSNPAVQQGLAQAGQWAVNKGTKYVKNKLDSQQEKAADGPLGGDGQGAGPQYPNMMPNQDPNQPVPTPPGAVQNMMQDVQYDTGTASPDQQRDDPGGVGQNEMKVGQMPADHTPDMNPKTNLGGDFAKGLREEVANLYKGSKWPLSMEQQNQLNSEFGSGKVNAVVSKNIQYLNSLPKESRLETVRKLMSSQDSKVTASKKAYRVAYIVDGKSYTTDVNASSQFAVRSYFAKILPRAFIKSAQELDEIGAEGEETPEMYFEQYMVDNDLSPDSVDYDDLLEFLTDNAAHIMYDVEPEVWWTEQNLEEEDLEELQELLELYFEEEDFEVGDDSASLELDPLSEDISFLDNRVGQEDDTESVMDQMRSQRGEEKLREKEKGVRKQIKSLATKAMKSGNEDLASELIDILSKHPFNADAAVMMAQTAIENAGMKGEKGMSIKDRPFLDSKTDKMVDKLRQGRRKAQEEEVDTMPVPKSAPEAEKPENVGDESTFNLEQPVDAEGAEEIKSAFMYYRHEGLGPAEAIKKFMTEYDDENYDQSEVIRICGTVYAGDPLTQSLDLEGLVPGGTGLDTEDLQEEVVASLRQASKTESSILKAVVKVASRHPNPLGVIRIAAKSLSSFDGKGYTKKQHHNMDMSLKSPKAFAGVTSKKVKGEGSFPKSDMSLKSDKNYPKAFGKADSKSVSGDPASGGKENAMNAKDVLKGDKAGNNHFRSVNSKSVSGDPTSGNKEGANTKHMKSLKDTSQNAFGGVNSKPAKGYDDISHPRVDNGSRSLRAYADALKTRIASLKKSASPEMAAEIQELQMALSSVQKKLDSLKDMVVKMNPSESNRSAPSSEELPPFETDTKLEDIGKPPRGDSGLPPFETDTKLEDIKSLEDVKRAPDLEERTDTFSPGNEEFLRRMEQLQRRRQRRRNRRGSEEDSE